MTSSARTLVFEGGRALVARLIERGCRERERNFVGREKGTENQRRGRRPLESGEGSKVAIGGGSRPPETGK